MKKILYSLFIISSIFMMAFINAEKVNAIVEKYKDIKSKSEKVSGPKLTLK